MKKLPDLEAWAIFAKVADKGSFAQVAAELGLSQATVSKAISRLEARLNTRLFHRTSRSIALTDCGLTALERAKLILQEGEAIEADITERAINLRGPIRVAAPMSFGLLRLAPMLPGFMQTHSDVVVDLHLSDAQVDVVADRFDVAIRIANLADSSLLARQLCEVRLYLVGTPSYFARHGRPTHPRDLAAHVGLQYSYSRIGPHWKFKHPTLGEYHQEVPTSLRANNAEALTPSLLAGMGLALQPSFLVWESLEAGTLEVALPDWHSESLALHIITPPGRNRPARVQAFIDYAAQRLRHAPWATVQPDNAPPAA